MSFMAVAAMLIGAAQAHGTEWFDVLSYGGETLAINPDIITTDNGVSYQVWVRNSFDTPESRADYSQERNYAAPVAYKLTLYKFTNNWKRFNIVEVSVYGEDGNVIDQYANADLAATESDIPYGSPIETIAENAKIMYDIKTNPE